MCPNVAAAVATRSAPSYKYLAILSLIATASLWGGNHVVIRAISADVPLVVLVFWRWTLTVAFLVPLAAKGLIRNRREIYNNIGVISCLGVLNCVVFSFAIIGAPYGTSALNVGILQATAPVWVIIVGGFLGLELISTRNIAAVLLGLAGVVIILTSSTVNQLVLSGIRQGDFLAVAAAIIWACYSLLLKKSEFKMPTLVLFAAMSLIGYFALVALFLLVLINKWSAPSLVNFDPKLTSLAGVIYVGIGATLCGNLLWNFGVKSLGASTASQYLFLAPVMAAVLSVIFLGEAVGMRQFLGALLVGISFYCKSGRAST
jgi:drug/metabolite transporter (DMT)-like permease